jgi:hypothetical protein
MAEDRKHQQPKRDAFVSEVVKNPGVPPNAMLLSGYIGDSSEPGHTRLYFDPQLRSYVDIPNAAILYSRPIPETASPLGGAYLWIKSDADLIAPAPTRFKARFLEGRIATAYGAAAGTAGGTAPGAAGFEPRRTEDWCDSANCETIGCTWHCDSGNPCFQRPPGAAGFASRTEYWCDSAGQCESIGCSWHCDSGNPCFQRPPGAAGFEPRYKTWNCMTTPDTCIASCYHARAARVAAMYHTWNCITTPDTCIASCSPVAKYPRATWYWYCW